MVRLSGATTTAFARHGMHLVCISVVIGWVLSYGSFGRAVSTRTPSIMFLHIPDTLAVALPMDSCLVDSDDE